MNFKRITRRSALGLLGIGIPSGAWAAAIEPSLLSVTRREISLPHWPKALDGFRIAQLTDLHYRPGTDDTLIARLHKALKEEKPDLIAISGDFVIDDPSSLAECLRALKGLSAPHGIFASPGNHDCWHFTPSQLKRHIEGAGIAYLENQGTRISIKGESVFLNGLDSFWGGHPDAARAWKGHLKNTPVLSLVHEPDPFEELHRTKPLDLQLSGHTHGGQCWVPLLNYAPIKVQFGRNFTYGEFHRGPSRLFVGRGLGTVGIRVRFACAPELVILTLRSS
jgi:predicted MPP superfamily phosphohydrolase